MKLTKAELLAAHVRRDWQTLWTAAIPAAKYAVWRMLRKGHLHTSRVEEDVTQDALLAAGQAVRLWNPAKGALSTWVVTYVQQKLLNGMRTARADMVGGRESGLPVVSMHEEEIEFAYDDPPEGFNTPEKEVEKQQAAERVAAVLKGMPDDSAELVKCLYGIGQRREGWAQYAARKGISLRTVATRRSKTLRALSQGTRLA